MRERLQVLRHGRMLPDRHLEPQVVGLEIVVVVVEGAVVLVIHLLSLKVIGKRVGLGFRLIRPFRHRPVVRDEPDIIDFAGSMAL